MGDNVTARWCESCTASNRASNVALGAPRIVPHHGRSRAPNESDIWAAESDGSRACDHSRTAYLSRDELVTSILPCIGLHMISPSFLPPYPPPELKLPRHRHHGPRKHCPFAKWPEFDCDARFWRSLLQVERSSSHALSLSAWLDHRAELGRWIGG